MSTELIEIDVQIREREKLIQKARKIVEGNEANLERVLKDEGLTEELLDMARQNLTDEQKAILEDMHRQINQYVCNLAQEACSGSDREVSENIQKQREKTDSLPLDAALKGSTQAAGDKKIKRKKKKNWA